MENNSRRCIISRKITKSGPFTYDRNIVFTPAAFTLFGSYNDIEKFCELPNVIIESMKPTGRCEVIDSDYAKENYLSLHNRTYEYKIRCYLIKEERCGVISNLANIDFTIGYKNFLNFLKDMPLWD